jgi:hypothetical protein
MYHVDRRGWSKVERVIVVVCMVVGDEGCEVSIVVYVKDGDRVKLRVGRIRYWQAFWMVYRHTVLSMQMAEVRWVVYWVTVVVGGGIVVRMACWNAWRLSDSLTSPHALCSSCRLVTSDPRSL